MPRDEDIIVIGGGAAGLVAAGMAASLGAKTLLVEERRLGGDCTWTGCVPSKTLLAASHAAHQMRTAGRHGLEPAEPRFDFARVMEHVRAVRQHIYEEADAPDRIEAYGVRIANARARFLDSHTVELSHSGGTASRRGARYFVIATGSRPRTLDTAAELLTNETLFELEEQPRRLLVLGAGPIGVEMAQAFHRLGTEVTVVAPEPRILARDDAELAAMLQDVLCGEGIAFRLGTKPRQIADGRATLEDGSVVEFDQALAAIGRAPNIENLNLEAAGVRHDERGIFVDNRCRTSQRHIYASGDVAGRFQFTHFAEHMSKVAISNAILKLPLRLDSRHITWATYTDPELAHVGASEHELAASGPDFRTYRFPYAELDRAITESNATGLVKVFATRSGRILGASILGAHAGEMIAEYALAMKNGLKLRHISDTIHPYPTYMLGNRRAADFWYLDQRSPRLIRWLQLLFGYRGGSGQPPG